MDGEERRGAPRHPAGENRARLLWDEGVDVHETSARLIDVSGTGARFVADSPPPPGLTVCFRLEAPRRSGWVTARVVRSGLAKDGGLAFARFNPHDLMTCTA